MCHAHMTYRRKVSGQVNSISHYFSLNNLNPDVTWAVVKQQLAEEDHFEVQAGKTVEGNVTPSAFIVAALELEDAQ